MEIYFIYFINPYTYPMEFKHLINIIKSQIKEHNYMQKQQKKELKEEGGKNN